MRTPCRSFWLVGICLARLASGAPETKPPSQEVRKKPEVSWQRSELPGGLRLALASGEPAEQVRLCTGFVVPLRGRDDAEQLSALVDTQMRVEALATEQQRTTGTALAWRRFDRVDGDTVLLCLSVPNDQLASALSTLSDASKSLVATRSDCDRAVEQWRAHHGLAELVRDELQAAHVQELAWLGSGAPPTLGFALRRAAAAGCEHWRAPAVWTPSTISLTVIGDVKPNLLQSEIRAQHSARQRQRAMRPTSAKVPTVPKLPAQSYPRFVRLRSSEVPTSAVILGWPFLLQGERQELGLRVIAAIIEQRLNRSLLPLERRASARVRRAGGTGTFEVEIRPTRADELSSTEERVLAVIDQLRTNHVSSGEIESALAQASSPTPLSGDLELDRAMFMAQKALLSWDARAMSQPADNPTPAELQQWTGRILSRTNIAEVFLESVAARQRGGARSEGQRPKGPTYAVKPGESLQMIARRFRVTIPELIRANRLHHPDQIAPGTRLVIPPATRTQPSK